MNSTRLTLLALPVAALSLLGACAAPSTSPLETPGPSQSVEGVVPVDVGTDISGADEDGQMPSMDAATAAGEVTCEAPKYGSVICTAPITNTTDQMAMLTTDMAFFNEDGVRIGTDGRYEEYVAPGETYVVQHYGPKKAASAKILSVEFSQAMTIPSTTEKRDGYYYLPPTDARVGKCKMQYGSAVCKLTITNSGPAQGEIDTTVAFYNADGVRLDSETRYQEKVPTDSTYRQDFYGPKGTAGVKVLALELQPDK